MRVGNLAREMKTKTPGQAAYEAWFHSDGWRIPFEQLCEDEQLRWHAVADAVIRQAKSIIAAEMVKAAAE